MQCGDRLLRPTARRLQRRTAAAPAAATAAPATAAPATAGAAPTWAHEPDPWSYNPLVLLAETVAALTEPVEPSLTTAQEALAAAGRHAGLPWSALHADLQAVASPLPAAAQTRGGCEWAAPAEPDLHTLCQ